MTAEQILREIGKIRRMERGSIAFNKRSCDSGSGSTGFYNHTVYENGRSKTRYVHAEDVEAVRQLIAEHKRFQQLVARYESLIIHQTRNERAKKRESRRKGK